MSDAAAGARIVRPGFGRRLARSPKGLTGLLGLAIIVLIALAATVLAPWDPAAQVLEWRFLPPAWATGGSAAHLLGGDNLGRDIFSRVIVGARVSILVGVAVVAIAGTIGSALGAIAGYFGGLVGAAIMRLADFQQAFPFLLLALMVTAILGPGVVTLVIALAFPLWVNFARVVRAEALRIRELDYVAAARAIGVTDAGILRGHVLPNVFPSIVVLATLDVALIVIAEAALSFLGLGVQPPTPSWGGMISEGRDFLADAPWMALGPGLAILVTAVSINLFGDFLRDTYDPGLTSR
jgi:ABC-type dipeptide/oligopeptide/nickel transport system permease subunit